ncbi:unnamed protein product [Pedinophyceae sp. YPF-701]|nr:unnamed protein product [Pedinophyceae sp. YPF-701]
MTYQRTKTTPCGAHEHHLDKAEIGKILATDTAVLGVCLGIVGLMSHPPAEPHGDGKPLAAARASPAAQGDCTHPALGLRLSHLGLTTEAARDLKRQAAGSAPETRRGSEDGSSATEATTPAWCTSAWPRSYKPALSDPAFEWPWTA